MSNLRTVDGIIMNFGRLCDPNDPRGNVRVVDTGRGKELQWVAEPRRSR